MERGALLEAVLAIVGPTFRGALDEALVRRTQGGEAELSISYVRERLSHLGESRSRVVNQPLAN